MKKISLFLSVLLSSVAVPVLAATPTSSAELAAAVDFADLKAGAMTIYALMIGVAVLLTGAAIVYRLVKR